MFVFLFVCLFVCFLQWLLGEETYLYVQRLHFVAYCLFKAVRHNVIAMRDY